MERLYKQEQEFFKAWRVYDTLMKFYELTERLDRDLGESLQDPDTSKAVKVFKRSIEADIECLRHVLRIPKNRADLLSTGSPLFFVKDFRDPEQVDHRKDTMGCRKNIRKVINRIHDNLASLRGFVEEINDPAGSFCAAWIEVATLKGIRRLREILDLPLKHEVDGLEHQE